MEELARRLSDFRPSPVRLPPIDAPSSPVGPLGIRRGLTLCPLSPAKVKEAIGPLSPKAVRSRNSSFDESFSLRGTSTPTSSRSQPPRASTPRLKDLQIQEDEYGAVQMFTKTIGSPLARTAIAEDEEVLSPLPEPLDAGPESPTSGGLRKVKSRTSFRRKPSLSLQGSGSGSPRTPTPMPQFFPIDGERLGNGEDDSELNPFVISTRARAKINSLLDSKQWKLAEVVGDCVQVYKNFFSEPWIATKGDVSIKAAPAHVCTLLWDIEDWSTWDPDTSDCKVLQELDEKNRIVYFRRKMLMADDPQDSQEEYCLSQSWADESAGVRALTLASVLHETMPSRRGRTRTVINASFRIYPDTTKPRSHCWVSMIYMCDPEDKQTRVIESSNGADRFTFLSNLKATAERRSPSSLGLM
eukprot:GILK01004263.1.p1 GENE.GILK01004263.1~~GILK01004263.1.p1  ORF type:complete len:425 (-),score=43.32 GILK01004263.1:387-1625(-)